MGKMTERMALYLELEAKLLAWRERHPEDTAEEDAILDEMDQVWWGMTEEERQAVEARKPGDRSHSDGEPHSADGSEREPQAEKP